MNDGGALAPSDSLSDYPHPTQAHGHSMEAGRSRLFQPPGARRWLLLVLVLTGCAAPLGHVDRALLAHRHNMPGADNPDAAYTVASPDVLLVHIAGKAELNGRHKVGPDGRIYLGDLGRLRVEGLALAQIVPVLAQLTGVSPTKIHVEVVAYNSRQIYVTGQVKGLKHAVAYRGPETVLDLLQRAGGITSGAAPGEVYVVRSHLGERREPEVFRVDLRAIVMKHDQRSNIYLQPLDQVFVGETLRCSLERCLPPWMRPLYETFWGMRRPEPSLPR